MTLRLKNVHKSPMELLNALTLHHLRIANNNYLIYKDRFNIVIGTKTRTNAIPAIIFYT